MSRRGENIHKRKDGRWEARVIRENVNGKNIYRSFYGKTYREAKTKKNNYILTRKEKSFVTKSFNDVFDKWIEYKKTFVKISTYNKYMNLYKSYICNYFYKINLDEITNQYIQNYISYLMKRESTKTSQTLSSNTIREIVYIIKSVLSYAQKNDSVVYTPLKVELPKNEVKKIHILTREEQKILESYIKNRNDMISIAIILCLYTGLRLGELCALTKNDIDLENHCISVNKTVQRIQNHDTNNNEKTSLVITKPKTKNSIRQILISSVIRSILERYLLSLTNKKYIFSVNNSLAEPRTIQYQFNKIIKRLNITQISFHGLRHTFATRCIELGMDMKTLSEILGHSNIATTMGIYVHSTDLHKKEQMELLSNL